MEETAQRASILQCCCGSPDCAFLAHNARQVDGLERNVSKAAELGKALLIRHETYVADSERERKQMLTTIEELEKEKQQLEDRNAQTIKENRHLLDQLEQLNEAVANSDAQLQALTDTLHSTEAELERLSALTTKTQLLERQLIDLEFEQSQLQNTLDLKIADERTAVQRWRRAEQTLADLQDQIDRIEKEAREERERHVEVVARMERRLAVDGELAAGRLNPQAGYEKNGSAVVSHFVKDILLDNTKLQHGILELREMLLNSNEEVERLRDQLRCHQPVSPSEAAEATPTLQKELGADTMLSQELHIHHHYHGSIPNKPVQKPKAPRRPRNKRFSVTPSYYIPGQADSTSQAAIISQTAATVPNTNRWSNATTLAPSLPSSPLSVSRRGSVYERVFSDAPYDSSRPTSPSDSIDPQSPMFAPLEMYAPGNVFFHQRKKSQALKPPSLATIRSGSTPLSITAKSSPATAVISAISPANSLANDALALSPSIAQGFTIPEENEDLTPSSKPQSIAPPQEDMDDIITMPLQRPTLRRAASHESLISISGMDIHTLQSRPSQLLLTASSRFASPGGAGSVGPELTPWTATATADMSRRNLDNTFNRSLLYSSLAASKRNASRDSSVSSTTTRQPSGLGNKLGGWVFGKWGATPAPSSSTLQPPGASSPLVSPTGSHPRPSSSKSASTSKSAETQLSFPSATSHDTVVRKPKPKKKEREVRLRAPGVNQSGPIWGFFDIPEAPSKVIVDDFDAEALGEALAEGTTEGG